MRKYAILLLLLLTNCMTVYTYKSTVLVQQGDRDIVITTALEPNNYFLDTTIENKSKNDIFLSLDESLTSINGEPVRLVTFSAVKSLNTSGVQARIPIPVGSKVSLEIANAKQTDGTTYDTWFSRMWGNPPEKTNKEINATFTFFDSKNTKKTKIVKLKVDFQSKRTI